MQNVISNLVRLRECKVCIKKPGNIVLETIKIRPDLAEAYNNRGNAYAEKGEYDLAIADFGNAIERRPDLAGAYRNRGLAHKMRGEKEEAIRDFERFLELSEDEDLRKEAEKQLRELRGQ